MAKVFNLHAAKTHLSRLVDAAVHGEEIVIAKAGTPVVRLVPIANTRKRTGFGADRGKIRIRGNFDAPLADNVLQLFGAK